uniref:Transducin family protein n=1 Tax=Rhizophora mucronata TaxID=61149 RepID=A0A2P2LEY4_RHIMU
MVNFPPCSSCAFILVYCCLSVNYCLWHGQWCGLMLTSKLFSCIGKSCLSNFFYCFLSVWPSVCNLSPSLLRAYFCLVLQLFLMTESFLAVYHMTKI